MRRSAAVAFTALLILCLAASAGAQGKDPFRPPTGAGGGAGTGAPGGEAEPPAAAPPADAPSEGGVARTGQDVASLFALGLAFLAVGAALRLAERGATILGAGRRHRTATS